jgi:hypothetical protein
MEDHQNRPWGLARTKLAADNPESKGSIVTSGFQQEHLDNRHRDTLRQIFEHPVSHNIEWRAVRSLLEAIGDTTVRHDGKYVFQLGAEKEILDPPKGKDIDAQMVLDLRRTLSAAGFSPPGKALSGLPESGSG